MLQLLSMFNQLISLNITEVEVCNLRIATYIFPRNFEYSQTSILCHPLGPRESGIVARVA